MKNVTSSSSCTVALPRQCNHATTQDHRATADATPNAIPDIRALANKVLQRNGSCNSNATRLLQVSTNIATELPHANPHEFNLDALKKLAGEDWDWIARNSILLKTFANACAVLKEMKQGKIPIHYTSKTQCQQCGEVSIPPELANNGFVLGCPWCLLKRHSNNLIAH